ncbi:MAG TPA: hypothetical protein VHU89_05205 [Acidobacteriaceae bacterium]|jgi:hypothetical protein|nr:hypothetical protein [Acidobacteriaceae bacterium]
MTMGAANLIGKLVEIERAVGRARAVEAHALVLEAQSCVLEIQRQMIETLRENVRLRERMEKYEPTVRARETRIPSNAEVARELVRMHKTTVDDALASLHLAVS